MGGEENLELQDSTNQDTEPKQSSNKEQQDIETKSDQEALGALFKKMVTKLNQNEEGQANLLS